jgi:hypothetical protein
MMTNTKGQSTNTLSDKDIYMSEESDVSITNAVASASVAIHSIFNATRSVAVRTLSVDSAAAAAAMG